MTDQQPKQLDPAEVLAHYRDPVWRLRNLYQIVTKGESEEDGLVTVFRPNLAQRVYLRMMHTRNLILKARQLGISTATTNASSRSERTWAGTDMARRTAIGLRSK